MPKLGARQAREYDAGSYRCTAVLPDGTASSHKLRSWRKVGPWLDEMKKHGALYTIVVDQSDMDRKYWSVRHEQWHKQELES